MTAPKNVSLTFTHAELDQLARLISVAVWFRSEQLANVGNVLEISTRDLRVDYVREQMRAGQEWFARFETAAQSVSEGEPKR